MNLYPTKDELITALKSVRKDAREWDLTDGIDVRLQCTEVGWQLHTGDASYDQDHRGVWGSDCVMFDSTAVDLAAIATRLIDECEEMQATS